MTMARESRTGRQILTVALIAAAIFGGGYWLKASYGISISKYTSGTVEPTGFEWPLFLLWALGGAALGATLMGWSTYRRRRN